MRVALAIISGLVFLSCKRNQEKNTQINWSLQQKQVYNYTQTKEGYLDSTIVRFTNYKAAVALDSFLQVVTRNYEEKLLVGKTEWYGPDLRHLKMKNQTLYTYNNIGKPKTVKEIDATNHAKFRRFSYDTAGRLTQEVVQQSDTGNAVKPKITILQTYYDTNSHVKEIVTSDDNHQVISKEVWKYSGNEPFMQYVLGPRGDTVQLNAISKNGQYVTNKIQTKQAIISLIFKGDVLKERLVVDSARKKMYRTVNYYNQSRLLRESRSYTAVIPQKEQK